MLRTIEHENVSCLQVWGLFLVIMNVGAVADTCVCQCVCVLVCVCVCVEYQIQVNVWSECWTRSADEYPASNYCHHWAQLSAFSTLWNSWKLFESLWKFFFILCVWVWVCVDQVQTSTETETLQLLMQRQQRSIPWGFDLISFF